MYEKVTYPDRVCEYCQSVFTPNRKDKKYCKRTCKQAASHRRQPEWRQKHNSRGRFYQRNKGSSCNRCGFVAVHRCQLDVHHIDYNHKNDDKSNLETLCANCHRLEHFG